MHPVETTYTNLIIFCFFYLFNTEACHWGKYIFELLLPKVQICINYYQILSHQKVFLTGVLNCNSSTQLITFRLLILLHHFRPLSFYIYVHQMTKNMFK